MTDSHPLDPSYINTREDVAQVLGVLVSRSRHPQSIIAASAGIGRSTLYHYIQGDHLPRSTVFLRILRACGVVVEDRVLDNWLAALERAKNSPRLKVAEQAIAQDYDKADLLFRVYIPSERLYAAEAHRLLSLFRDWLTATRRHGVRQAGYRTASGEMYEFFADPSLGTTDVREEFDSFSDFLTLCSEDPSAAVDVLASSELDRKSSTDLVARFGKEVRRLQIDLRHERERRMLTIRHSLEEQLLENQVDLRGIHAGQLNAMVESLVPDPSAPESLALLAVPWTAHPTAPVTVNFNPQIINTIEGTVIQNVQGTVHLGATARQVLELIDHFGGQEAASLQSAVHELEDQDAPPAARSAAKRRLKKFANQLAGTVHDVAIDLLKKYLESKVGL